MDRPICMMFGSGSTYFLVACVVVGATAVFALGLLFVRASNIERPNLVAGVTFLAALSSGVLLSLESKGGIAASDSASLMAITICVAGFILGRIIDLMAGGRTKVHHDDATLDADLAD